MEKFRQNIRQMQKQRKTDEQTVLQADKQTDKAKKDNEKWILKERRKNEGRMMNEWPVVSVFRFRDIYWPVNKFLVPSRRVPKSYWPSMRDAPSHFTAQSTEKEKTNTIAEIFIRSFVKISRLSNQHLLQLLCRLIYMNTYRYTYKNTHALIYLHKCICTYNILT